MVLARNQLRDRIQQRSDNEEHENTDGRILIVYGCAAHFIHLIEKEVSPRTVIAQIVEAQKYFRNHHLPQGLLREKGGKKPQIPNDTRWTSWQCLTRT